jgi:hypothetical protein
MVSPSITRARPKALGNHGRRGQEAEDQNQDQD